MTTNQLLVEGSLKMGIKLSDEQVNQFNLYKKLLLEWNEKINLTAIEEDRDIDIKHFLDSISCSQNGLIKGDEKAIDVGTGAGFPGIPLKIVFPQLRITLLDSLNKRINFLKEVAEKLNLKNIEFIHGRAEDFGVDVKYREQYNLVLSRAVANLSTLSEYCLPFLSVGGKFICQKGPDVEKEVEEGRRAVEVLGGKIQSISKIALPDSDITHSLIVIEKQKKTPTNFPRKAGKPSKDPIK